MCIALMDFLTSRQTVTYPLDVRSEKMLHHLLHVIPYGSPWHLLRSRTPAADHIISSNTIRAPAYRGFYSGPKIVHKAMPCPGAYAMHRLYMQANALGSGNRSPPALSAPAYAIHRLYPRTDRPPALSRSSSLESVARTARWGSPVHHPKSG